MRFPATHLKLTYLAPFGKYVDSSESRDEPPSGGVPLRAIAATWFEDMFPSDDSRAYVQVKNGNLFIYDPSNSKLWHLTVPEEHLQRMRETEQVVLMDQAPYKEGSEVLMLTIPVRPDYELTELLVSRN